MESTTGDFSDESSSRASSAGRRGTTRELALCSTATTRRRNESDDDYLSRVTHLRLQNKGISSLDNPDVFDACHSLKVLYLYDNCVESLKGLEKLQQIEQLFADNNLLTTIQGTLSCRRLRKLHLSGNSVSKLRGLETANCLEELNVARQRLQRGQCFTIEQASIDGIKDSLVLLDASGNGMGGTEIAGILHLHRLETLNLAENDIQEMAQARRRVVDLLSSLEVLRDLDLRGNVVSRMAKYFERAVTRCGDLLATLDGKPVHAQHRSMLQRLDRHKRSEARKSAAKTLSRSNTHAPIAEPGAQRENSARLHDGDFSTGHSHSQHQDPAKKSSMLDLNPSLRTTRAGVRFASSVDTSSSGTSQDDRNKPLISWASSR
ncbi:unnamed protein product [Ectocarpus sp. 12 AP-2014]